MYLFTYPSIYLFIYSSIYLLIYLSIYLFVLRVISSLPLFIISCRSGKSKVSFVLILPANRNTHIKCGWIKWNQRITFRLIYQRRMILPRSSTLLVSPIISIFYLLLAICLLSFSQSMLGIKKTVFSSLLFYLIFSSTLLFSSTSCSPLVFSTLLSHLLLYLFLLFSSSPLLFSTLLSHLLHCSFLLSYLIFSSILFFFPTSSSPLLFFYLLLYFIFSFT